MKKVTKKKKLAIKSKPKKPTLLDLLPRNHGERLAVMIRLTERSIKNPEFDKDMVNQANRLKAELEQWNKENKK